MRRLLLALALLWPSACWATNPMCPTRPAGDSTNACASTAFVTGSSITSVAITVPAWLTIAGSPIIAPGGTIAITSTSEAANLFLASPNGSSGVMSPRAIAAGDINGLAPNFSTTSVATLSIGAAGMVGDGSTVNNTAYQNALTAIASGGIITLPCGKYKITASASITVPSGAHVTVRGSGSECTKLYYAGTSITTTLTLTDRFSGFSFESLSFTTNDATGSNTAVTLVGSDTGYGAASVFRDVTIRGDDGYGITDYFGTGVTLTSVSFVDYYSFNFFGSLTSQGNGVNITSITAKPGQEHNFTNSSFNRCNQGIIYGNLVQGVTVTSTNFTGCNYAIVVPPSLPALDQLAIVNSQFNSFNTSIVLNSNVPNTNISNSIFIVEPSGYAISFGAAQGQFSWVGGTVGGANTTNTGGLLMNASGGNGLIEGVHFDSLFVAVNAVAGAGISFVGNTFLNVATVMGGTPTIIAYGNTPEVAYTIANLPTCAAATNGITLALSNGTAYATGVYGAAVGATGAVWRKVFCTPSLGWVYN